MSFLLESPSVIEGVGRGRADLLRQAGIETIADMFAARAASIHALLPGTSPAQAAKWICAATLFRVSGIDADLAEAMVGAGIRSVPQLAEAGLQTLERAVESARDANRLNEVPSLYKLAELQREAWRMRGRGMLAGKVLTADGEPVAGALVEADRYDARTDDRGRYAFHAIPEGSVRVEIRLPHLARAWASRQPIAAGKLRGPLVSRLRSAPAGTLEFDTLHELDGALLTHAPGYRSRLVTLPLASFHDGTHFLVRKIESNGDARLLSLYKRRTGTELWIERAEVSAQDMPHGSALDTVLELDDGSLRLTDLTSAGVQELKRQRWSAIHAPRSRVVFAASEPGDE